MDYRDSIPIFIDPDEKPVASPFLIHSLREIKSILQTWVDTACDLYLYHDPEEAPTITQISAISPEQDSITLTAEFTDELVHLLQQPNVLVLTGFLENVKIQFPLREELLVKGHGGSALQAALPHYVYKFQRRKVPRVKVQDQYAPNASFFLPELMRTAVSARVLNVSEKGCSLIVPPASLSALHPGQVLSNTHVYLDPNTDFLCHLMVHHIARQPTQSNQPALVGCEFLNLQVADQYKLNSYIDLILLNKRTTTTSSTPRLQN